MKNLPENLGLPIAHPSQLDYLREWNVLYQTRCAALEAAQTLSAEIVELSPASNLAGVAESHDAATRLKSGSVLLLSPELTPSADRPVYVALLFGDRCADESWVCAGFSDFTVPALPAELLLPDRADTPLAVIQVWRAITLPAEVLARAWYVDELSQTEMKAAKALFHAQFKGLVPADLAGRVGPPVVKGDDPRIGYQNDEIAQLGHLMELAAQWRENYDAGSHLLEQQWFTELSRFSTPPRQLKMPMAAADRTPRFAVSVYGDCVVDQAVEATVVVLPESPPEGQTNCILSCELSVPIAGITSAWLVQTGTLVPVARFEVLADGCSLYCDQLAWEDWAAVFTAPQFASGLCVILFC